MKRIKYLLAMIIVIGCGCVTYNCYANNTISEDNSCYAIKNDKTLWTWTPNIDDDGVQKIHSEKILDNVVSVKTGYAIKSDGTLWALRNGYLSDQVEFPVKVMGDVASIYEGRSHALIIKKDRTLWGIGYNDEGQLGTGENIEQYYNPVKIMNNVKDAAVGSEHSIVLKTDGSVWTFGSNAYGQLGCGKEIKKSGIPIKVMDNVKNIYAGVSASFAVTDDKKLFRWGTNYGDIVGDNSDLYKFTPTEYTDCVSQVSSKWGFNLVVKDDGTLWAYGESEEDEHIALGNNRSIDAPVKIADGVNCISEYSYIDFNNTLVLKDTGELFEFNIVPQEKEDDAQYVLNEIFDDVKLSNYENDVPDIKYEDISEKSEEIQKSIEALSKAGIIYGTSENEFSPDKYVSRAEAAAMFLRMIGKENEQSKTDFTDVTSDKWYYNIAGTSQKYGLINGFEDNTFRGDDTISNIQFITLCARVLMNETNTELKETINFENVPDWAKKEIAVAVGENLISADNKILESPNENITRGEAAVILYKLYNKI